MTNTLITYFSASGVTKNIAEKLQEYTNGDIFEIEPKIKYTAEDLDWTNKESRSTIEMNDKTFRPEIKETLNVSEYEIIFMGFPVWWYTAPTIINTFLDTIEFKGTIVPFCTSGGTGIEGCQKDLENAYPNLKWGEGKRLTGRESKEDLEKWLNQK